MCAETEREIGGQIICLSHLMRRRMNAKASACGVHSAQGRILMFILDHPDAQQRDVERVFHLRPSTATGLLQRLEKEGLISRESCPGDARRKRLIPTEKGRALSAQIEEERCAAEALFRQGIDPAELAVFEKVLGQMLSNLAADPRTQNTKKQEGGVSFDQKTRSQSAGIQEGLNPRADICRAGGADGSADSPDDGGHYRQRH